MKLDILIKNGKVWTDKLLKSVDVGIKDGKIVYIGNNEELESKETIDANELLVLPGGIDVHTHCEDGTVESREDFYTFTKACAASGVTSVFVMPTPGVLVNSKERFKQRHELIKDRAYVDYGLIGGAGSDNLDKIMEQAEAGVVAFKTFCCNPEWEGEDTEGCCSFNNGSLIDIMKNVKNTGLVHMLHVQDTSITDYLVDDYKNRNINTIEAFKKSLSSIVETSGVATALALSNHVKSKVHFCHMSYKDSLELIRDAKRRGQDVTCEVLTCGIELTSESIDEQFPDILWYPLPGSTEDKKAIYEGIEDGTVDMINSDHSPFSQEEMQESIRNSIFDALPGGTNLEVTLPLLLDRVNSGKLSLETAMKLFMEKPAKRFGLYPKKGAIKVGSDADLVLVDMNKEKTFTKGEHFIKLNYTQFDGLTLKGNPVLTMVRGNVIMKDNEIVAQAGIGKLIKPLKQLSTAKAK